MGFMLFFFTTAWKLKIRTNWKVSMNFDALFYFKKVDKTIRSKYDQKYKNIKKQIEESEKRDIKI